MAPTLAQSSAPLCGPTVKTRRSTEMPSSVRTSVSVSSEGVRPAHAMLRRVDARTGAMGSIVSVMVVMNACVVWV
jgi:hypothetical protein